MEKSILEQLAPWIAIAFTLALSILVPLFTQIANNRFQIKMQKLKEDTERKNMSYQEKREIYANFLHNVGGCIAHATSMSLDAAGASIQKMYLVCPETWWPELDELYSNMRNNAWGKAETILKKLNKLIAKEYILIK